MTILWDTQYHTSLKTYLVFVTTMSNIKLSCCATVNIKVGSSTDSIASRISHMYCFVCFLLIRYFKSRLGAVYGGNGSETAAVWVSTLHLLQDTYCRQGLTPKSLTSPIIVSYIHWLLSLYNEYI